MVQFYFYVDLSEANQEFNFRAQELPLVNLPLGLQDSRETSNQLMTSDNDFYCHTCKKRFTNNTTLARHMKVFHSSREVPQCKICGKRTSSWYDLKVHEKVHNTARPYSCDVCKKSYKYKQDLKSHKCVLAITKFEDDASG